MEKQVGRKVKAFLYRIRIPLIEWYFVAASCYFCMMGFEMSFFSTAVVIGFVNTYLVAPIAFSLSEDQEKVGRDFLSEPTYIFKNVVKAVIIVSSMVGLYFLVNEYLFSTQVDPYSFGLVYWVLNKIVGKLIKKWN